MSYEASILKIIESNREQSAADFRRINELIKENNLSYKNICVRTLAVPKVLTAERYAEIGVFITKLYEIFDKIINHYFADAAYRALFGFEEALEALILDSRRRNGWVPMARIDFFLNEETGGIKMCEINTDGTSAMNEDRLLGEFLHENKAFQTYMKDKTYRRFELFDSWVKEFLSVYQAFCDEENSTELKAAGIAPKAPQVGQSAKAAGASQVAKAAKAPNVAIVDFLDVGYVTEFERFKATFLRHGIETEICDIRDLCYDGEVLRTKSGMIVDAIYRRAVTSDIMSKFAEVGDFIHAVKERAVCLIGDFVTQIVHNKRLFFVLFHEQTKAILTESEHQFVAKHFPATYYLTKENIAANHVYQNREEWIIKPCDSYGAKGFFAGRNLTEKQWIEACEEHLQHDYILQEFNAPYKTLNIDFSLTAPVVREYSNLTGIFCYNGKPYGAYSRMADGEIISTQYDEKTIATILV